MAKKGKWKTAESAPRDGSRFLGFCVHGLVAVVKYLEYTDKFVVAWDHTEFTNMDYWRPMVKLPNSREDS